MKAWIFLCVAAALLAALGHAVNGQIQAPPSLSIQWVTNSTVRVAWTNSDMPFVLESADHLFPEPSWQEMAQPVGAIRSEVPVTLNTSAASRFFRLRSPDLTRITQSSPANGETGVSVTRETIFRFNYALASNTVLRTSDVFAEFGGRRYLSRVELASDRKSVTLFYLEPLPGSARVRVTFQAAGLTDQFGRLVDLDGDGQPGGVARIEFDTLSLTALPGTGIIGTVYASEQIPGTNATNFINRPLGGVTITVDGMEQTLRTVTGSNGSFRLMPCPAGDFFVHIDGRTATTGTTAGAYYPYLGKAWESLPGQATSVGDFFLPLVPSGTLQTTSAVSDTIVRFAPSVIQKFPD
jgi:hypothetical protein